MNDWNNYMNENRNVFDEMEPVEGHFERFEERLNRIEAEKKRKRSLKIILASFSVAASVLIIIFAGIRFYSSPDEQESEFMVTNGFYKAKMNEQIAEIRCKLDKADDETRNQLENDLQKIIDENNNFAKEICNDANKELAIYYLVEHYKMNLQALQFIDDRLGNYFKC